MLFEGHKQIDLDLPDSELSLENLIEHLKKHHLKEKEEMFV
jgi:hypothetical protein